MNRYGIRLAHISHNRIARCSSLTLDSASYCAL